MKGFLKKISFLIFIASFIFALRVDGIWAELKGQGYVLTTSLPINQNNNFEYRAKTFEMKNGYLALDPSEVTYVSELGKPLWRKKLSSQNVDGVVSDKWMVLCEKKSGDLFVLDKNGEILAEKFALGQVKSVQVLNDKYIAVLKENRELILLDKTLKISSTTMLPKGKIVDFGLNPENTEIVVGLLDLSRSDFNTKILFTDLQGNIKSGSHIYEAIAYGVFLEDDVIIMIVDSGILIYNYRGELVSKVETKRTIQNFFYDKNNNELFVHYVDVAPELDSTKPESEIVVYNIEGKAVRAFKPPLKEIKGMQAFGSELMLFSKNELFVMTLEGKVDKKYTYKEEIQHLRTVGTKSFALEFIGKMDVYVKK